jgi:multidrug efflux pump subunit AcrA (membrane-fusion protein)
MENPMNARPLILCASVALLALSGQTPAVANEKNEPAKRVDLRGRVTGYVTKVHFKDGDTVKKDEVLFELDDRVYRLQLALTEAQLRVAEAKFNLCEAELKRAQNLFQQKAISDQDLDKYTADRAIADAERNAAKATLKLAQFNLDFTKIRAPIDGKIGRALVTEGNLAKADDTLLATIESGGVKAPVKDAKPSAKMLELMKERQKVLTEASRVNLKMYQDGAVALSAVMPVERALLEASLDLCETNADRLDLLRKSVVQAEHFHRLVDARVKVGQAPPTEALQTRALVLEAQIRLLREEEKAKANK